MSTTTLPEKWAVEITSLEDAERLQKLYPEYDCKSKENEYLLRRKSFRKAERLNYCPNSIREMFDFDRHKYFKEKGYTIYTITELEALKSQE